MPHRKYLTSSEVEKMLNASLSGKNPKRDYCLIKMCFLHGCRVSELSNIRLSDLDLSNGKLWMQRLKNGFSTVHPLYKDEKEDIESWLAERRNYRGAEESDCLFLTSRGNRMSRQRIYRLFQKYGVEAGLSVRVHPHMLRHACGFALADQGADTRLIQDFLGHRNISHTVIYTAANPERFNRLWKGKKGEGKG